MIPVEIKKISYHPSTRSYAVILNEIGGKRFLPVIVGSFEAQSIALAIELTNTPRPLTHDLICNMINSLKLKLKTVKISNLSDGVFYAIIELFSDQLGEIKVDSRPSDAIAVALRLNSPILVSEKLMNDVGITDVDYINQSFKNEKTNISLLNNLKKRLEEAIEQEEYERAARLRDKITEMES